LLLAAQLVAAPSAAREAAQAGLTLSGALQRAFAANPDLAASVAEVGVAEAMVTDAGLSPSSRVGLSVANLGGPEGGALFLRTTLRLSRTLELGGKRSKRVRLAQVDRRLRDWDLQERRLAVAVAVARRLASVAAARERLRLAERDLEVSSRALALVRQRSEAGLVPGARTAEPEAEQALAAAWADRARRGLVARQASLAATWAGDAASVGEVAVDLGALPELPPEHELAALLPDTPALARWQDEVGRHRRAGELERATRVPNLTLGAGIRYFPDAEDAAAVLDLSLPLPILNRNQGRILSAERRSERATQQHEAARSAARASLARIHARLGSALHRERRLVEQALPAARRSLAAARERHERGRTSALAPLRSERRLLGVQRQLVDVREQAWHALADLDGLTGAALHPARS